MTAIFNKLAAKAEASGVFYFITLFSICLCVFAATFYFPTFYRDMYDLFSAKGMEIHRASFLAHLIQTFFYDSVLIIFTWAGMKLLRIPLPEIGWKKPTGIGRILLSTLIMLTFLIVFGMAQTLLRTRELYWFSIQFGKNWSDLGNPSVYIFIFTSVFNAPLEEIFYRGFLQTAIEKKLGAKHAIIISALAYAAAHINVSNNLSQIFASGLILGSLKKWGNDLWNPIAAHLTKNIFASWLFIRF